MLVLEIITGVLLPWVLLAPTIPLLLLLVRRNHTDKTTTALALLCVVSVLSNVFILVAAGSELQPAFFHISFLTETIFTGLLLKYCTHHNPLRYGIMAAILIYGSVYITLIGFAPGNNTWVISTLGTSMVFVMSVLVLLTKTNKLDQNLALSPEFWFAGGVFLHFGLLDLLLFAGKKITDLNYNTPDDYSVIYVTVFVLQFLFFAAGILIRKPWINNG